MSIYEENKIAIGDIVDVSISQDDNVYIGDAEVLHIASETGECWRFKGSDGNLYYVQNFAYIKKLW